jgi:hypothetical protein
MDSPSDGAQGAGGDDAGRPVLDAGGDAGLDEHDRLVTDIWHLEERILRATRQGIGGLESRLEIERARSALVVKKAELAALRARQADQAVQHRNGAKSQGDGA